MLDNDKIALTVGGQEMVLDKQTISFKQGSNTVKLGAAGITVKGSVIKWG